MMNQNPEYGFRMCGGKWFWSLSGYENKFGKGRGLDELDLLPNKCVSEFSYGMVLKI